MPPEAALAPSPRSGAPEHPLASSCCSWRLLVPHGPSAGKGTAGFGWLLCVASQPSGRKCSPQFSFRAASHRGLSHPKRMPRAAQGTGSAVLDCTSRRYRCMPFFAFACSFSTFVCCKERVKSPPFGLPDNTPQTPRAQQPRAQSRDLCRAVSIAAATRSSLGPPHRTPGHFLTSVRQHHSLWVRVVPGSLWKA